MQSRQEPNASTMSVAQSFGIWWPASIAARMIEVPSGTVTWLPSMVSVTIVSDFERGVPKSISSIRDIVVLLFRGLKRGRGRDEILPEVLQCAEHGVGREAAERAERAEFHGVAEVFDECEVFAHALALDDLLDGLDAAGRADPARRALAAGFDGAEFHGETRLLAHVDAVVEHDDTAVADQAVARGEGLVVERRVEQRAREVGAQGASDLYRADRAARERAAAVVVDELAERHAEGRLEQPAVADVAGELDRHRTARATHAEIGIGLGAFGQDEGDGGERQHVVDDGRLAEQAVMRGQWRLCAHEATTAFEAFQQRGLFAANVSAGADAHLEIEAVRGTTDVRAEIAAALRSLDGRVHRLDRVRIFAADVDVTLGRADGNAGGCHALDDEKGIAFHDHAVGEGAAVAFVGVADDELAIRFRLRDRLPLYAGREACAAAAAQAGRRHFIEDGFRAERQRAFEALVAAMGAVVIERARVDHAAAREGEAGLALEPRDLVGGPEPQQMRRVARERVEQGGHIGLGHGAERDPALRCRDLDQRLEPLQAARAGPDDLDGNATLGSSLLQRQRDLVGADRKRARVARDI